MKNILKSASWVGILSIFLTMGCRSVSSNGAGSDDKKQVSGAKAVAPCIIYKTKSDYSKNVPVMVSEDKTKIVSYPDRKDVYYEGKLSYPAELDNGFLLDNRGIGPNVAFLNYTYEEYSKLESTPSAGELWKRILDKDPLLEMYQCGNRYDYKDPVKELNLKINKADFSAFKKLR